jgi:hypothetical protein
LENEIIKNPEEFGAKVDYSLWMKGLSNSNFLKE